MRDLSIVADVDALRRLLDAYPTPEGTPPIFSDGIMELLESGALDDLVAKIERVELRYGMGTRF